MIDPVAWAIGELGAEHSPEIARVLAYAATSGGEGVIAAGDLKVRPLATPGTSVRIGPGAMVALNRASAGRSQSFVARVISDENVPIAATGAGAGRTDLVALVVRDTSIAGNGSTPADPAVGPYVHAIVVPGVSASVTRLQQVAGYEFTTGVALARVTLPASTGTITSGMITDLRQLPLQRSEREVVALNSTGAGKVNGSYVSPDPLNTTTFKTWPTVATTNVNVPVWATHAVVTGTVYGAAMRTGDVWGDLRVTLGTVSAPVSSYDENWSGNPYRIALGAGGTIVIPDAMKGTTVAVKIEGKRSGGAGNLTAQAGVTSVIDVQFVERAV